MPRKTFRAKDEYGKIIDIDPSAIQIQPVVREELSDDFLKEAKEVYEMLREVVSCNGRHMTLEEFEIQFMRSVDHIAELKVFKSIAMAYQKACGLFPNDSATKDTIYRWLVLLVMGAVTEQEAELEEVKIIAKCFMEVA